jgi:hypothetical protein
MLLRGLVALAVEEARRALRSRLRKWLPAWLLSRPPGLPEKTQPLTHRDAERIRRQTHVPEEHKR